MAHLNTVVKSINNHDSSRCVDIFHRPDGTCGFEEYRRDPEDQRGWFPVGFYGEDVFETENSTASAAAKSVRWFETR